ncbi:cytochrome P450 4C1-like [Prorops nasuta]|uniref:cytochrome P450 4C1-like n=1 Tax=Prorops nasuta TaxID=863751 RepID=UPI0034CD1581
MITAILLALAIALFGFHYFIRKGRIGRLICKIPGPKSYPIIGNLYAFKLSMKELWTYLRYLNNEYYPIYKIWSITTALVNIRHPDDAEVLLTSTKHIEKSELYNFLHPWFGTGLLTSTGSKWQNRRKILTPAFHFNILQQFVDIFVEESERMCDSLKVEKGPVVMDLVPLLSESTLNAVCETAMGTSLQGRGEFQYKYREAVHQMGELLVHRLVNPWLHEDWMFALSPTYRRQSRILKILHGFTKKIIGERNVYHNITGGRYLKGFENKPGVPVDMQESDEQPLKIRKKRLAMLDLLIAANRDGNQIDENGIREEVDTFMFEGHDTTAQALVFVILLLAEHQDAQERCRQEVEEVWLENDGEINAQTLQRMPYLERCIKESLRLYPSVPFISRYIEEDLHLKKYIIPGGTIAHVHIYDVHRDPNFWPNPEEFDPDRFLPENIIGRHPFSYIPFSAGPRNCIGQKFAFLEMKCLVAYLLRNFHIGPVDRIKDIVFMADLVLRASHPLRVKFTPIKH